MSLLLVFNRWFRILTACLAGLAFAGCAATTPPPRFTATSPAEEAGVESPVAPPRPLLTGEGELAERPREEASEAPTAQAPAGGSARAADPHAGHSMAGPQAATPAPGGYTCTMHPQVTAAEPGTCPICGMALVPKAQEPKR